MSVALLVQVVNQRGRRTLVSSTHPEVSFTGTPIRIRLPDKAVEVFVAGQAAVDRSPQEVGQPKLHIVSCSILPPRLIAPSESARCGNVHDFNTLTISSTTTSSPFEVRTARTPASSGECFVTSACETRCHTAG